MTVIAFQLLGTLTVAVTPAICTITDIDRVETFMGKRGYRVSETISVSHQGKQTKISLYAYHTNVANTRRFQVGDQIEIPNLDRKGKFAISEIRYVAK